MKGHKIDIPRAVMRNALSFISIYSHLPYVDARGYHMCCSQSAERATYGCRTQINAITDLTIVYYLPVIAVFNFNRYIITVLMGEIGLVCQSVSEPCKTIVSILIVGMIQRRRKYLLKSIFYIS